MLNFVSTLFWVDVVVLFVLLIGVIWSVAVPGKRIWPPPSKNTWQYYLTWISFYLVFGFNALLIIFDWNSWVMKSPLRLIIGVPLILIGPLLLIWAIRVLGGKNTSGLPAGFIKDGPYRFTRNPQYIGDMVLFLGLSLMANSLYLWITHFLLILVFLITPLAEEIWLEEQYGETYPEYRRETSRFL